MEWNWGRSGGACHRPSGDIRRSIQAARKVRISFSLAVSLLIHRRLRVLAQVELDFNSVERIVEYLDVPQEAPAIIEEKRPPAYWPSSNGELTVRDLEVKYAPDLPSVLHRISFTVHPSEKIGIVGRTGSGRPANFDANCKLFTHS